MSIQISHWAESLETCDRVYGTLRHPTDGTLNIIDAPLVVVENRIDKKEIYAMFGGSGYVTVPYNELKEYKP